jgi:hypothetical protein
MQNALLSGLETMPQEQQQQNAALSGQIVNQTNALKLQQAQKFSSLLSQMAAPQGKDGTPPTASNQMMQLGLTAMRAGLPQGMTMVNNAVNAQAKLSEAASRQVTAQAAQTRAHVAALKQQIAQYEQHMAPAAGALSQVTDPASWEQFTNFMQQRYGDSEYLGTPYNPQTVHALQYQMMGTKNALVQAKNKADAVHQQSVLDEQAQYHQVMERAAGARAEAERVSAEASRIRAQNGANRNARLAKVGGGKEVSPPPNNMILQSQSMVKREFPEMGSVDSQDFSYSIAASARAMMQKNPGLNAQAAIMQALSEQKDQYVLEKPKLFGGETPVFNPKGTGIAESFKTPQEVVAAYKGGKIPKAEAENFLRAMGAH